MVAVNPEKLAKTGRQKAERPAVPAFTLAGACPRTQRGSA